MLAIILPTRKTVTKKTWRTQQQNFWIKITASRLSYEPGLHDEKNFIGNPGTLWKMDIVKMTHFIHYLVKRKILRVIFIMKLLPWSRLTWRGNSVPKECCGYFSHPLDVLKQFLNKVLGPADIVVETWAKNCSEPFCNY